MVSLNADSSIPYDLAPLCDLGADKGGEFLGLFTTGGWHRY